MSACTFPPLLPAYATLCHSSKELIRAVRSFMEKDLNLQLRGKHCVLAVSGGADSLALVCIFQWLRPVCGHTFSVLHINHGLRAESEDEAHFVKALCAAWDIPFFAECMHMSPHATGIEEHARHMRYTLYEKYRQQCQAFCICLGHHIRDVQEDVLMRLMRGCAWPALGGMVAHDKHRHIVRPLLMQEPEHLRKLLQEIHVTWAEDASNADTQYLRNRVRHTILPLFQAENAAFSQKIAEMWHLAQYDRDHWQEVLSGLCAEYDVRVEKGCLTLPAKLLQNIDKATRLRLYHFALDMVHMRSQQSPAQGRAQTFFQLDAAFQEGRGGTEFQFSGSIVAKLKKGHISFMCP